MKLSDSFPDAGQRGSTGPTGGTGPTGPTAAYDPASGSIVMWPGTLATIPTGWVLCNGSNGTPDLRDMFIKGAAAGVDPGGTGGATTHGHAAHGAQSHSGTTVSDHPALAHSGFAVANHETATYYCGLTFPVVIYSATHTTTQHNDHASVSHTVTQPSDHASQSHVDANNLPAYYTMAFIMKT